MTNTYSRLMRLMTLTVLLPAAVVAQDARQRAMATAADVITEADVKRDVDYLASDPLLGRSTLEPGYDSAAAYVARELKRLGIQPAGDSGGYFQHYTMISSRLDTSKVSGTVGGQVLRYGDHFVVQSFLTPGVLQGGVVYVGGGLRAPAHNIDEYAGLDVRGKWLLIKAGFALPTGVTRQQLGSPGVDYFSANEEARSRGAIGILVLPSDGAVNGWNSFRNRAVTGRDLTPSVGRAYAAYPLPRIMLSRDGVRLLAGSNPQAAALVATSDSTFKSPAPFDLNQVLQLDLAATTTTYRPYNVAGLIPGSDPTVSDQWISVTAHLDGAVGRGATPEGDSVYNAADDNASGSAGNLGVARALMSGPRPKRSVLMTWDSGEEIGLWGSRHMAYNAADKIVAHFNIDMIGRTRAPGSNNPAEEDLAGPNEVWVSGPAVMSTMMHRVLTAVQANYQWAKLTPKYDDPAVSFFYPRTDAAPFMENGIPVLQFFTGLHADYHRQGDAPEKLDIPKMTNVSKMVYATVWLMADDAERPRWDKPVPAELHFVTPKP